MIRRVFSLLACMTAITAVAIAQTPKMPAQQAKFCSILSNWKFRGGYAPGQSAPKSPDNPIAAAREPKQAPPGNLFDQLVDVLGASGEFTGWKGTVVFNVRANERKVWVQMSVSCPDVEGMRLMMSLDHRTWLPLDSPIADFLATVHNGSPATFSGHLFYVPAFRFYQKENGRNPRREGGPGVSSYDVFFGNNGLASPAFLAEFTGISK